MARSDRAAPGLLGPGDPPPFEILRPEGKAPVLLSCDHASRTVPATLDRLGLDEATLARHIGWDIGAAGVTRLMSKALEAPAILGGYSRLVIDCNRGLADPTLIPALSDGVGVPGNRDLSPAARQARIDAIFEPYHRAITQTLDGFARREIAPAFLSIHSFTPVMNGFARPWHVGILWDKDPRLPCPMIERLRRDRALVVGDNEPYSAREPAGHTVRTHAVARGLPHVAVELRQDLVADDRGVADWAERLLAAFRPLLAAPGLFRVEHY